jgi:hypothetical protein
MAISVPKFHRIRLTGSAGAEVGYIAMDDPLWFGHYYNGKNACHSSIDNVAERVAKNLHEYLKVFPNAIIGDGEPIRPAG